MSEEKYFVFYFHVDSQYVSVSIKDVLESDDIGIEGIISDEKEFGEAMDGWWKDGKYCAVIKGRLLKPRVVKVVEKFELE